MQVRTRAVRSQFQKLYALETETDHRSLFSVLVAFVPNASLRRQHFRILSSEPIKTGAAQAIFAVNKKPQRYRQLAESFLVGLNRGHPGHQIAFAVGCSAGVKLAVDNRRCKRSH